MSGGPPIMLTPDVSRRVVSAIAAGNEVVRELSSTFAEEEVHSRVVTQTDRIYDNWLSVRQAFRRSVCGSGRGRSQLVLLAIGLLCRLLPQAVGEPLLPGARIPQQSLGSNMVK